MDSAQTQQSFQDEFAPVANVPVFPSLDAGNIGYRVTQRTGGAGAFRPVLQGPQPPAYGLSCGAGGEDVANVPAITAAQSGTAD